MNRAFADSPDNAFKLINPKHPCAHRTIDANGLVTVIFVHVHNKINLGCSRCAEIFPITFWQYQETSAVEQVPS